MWTRRVWGWMFFDWASQPYNTLLLTFLFGPYFAQIAAADLMAGGATEPAARAGAQALWGWGLTVAGLSVAVLAPVLGAIADHSGRRMAWIAAFSALYVAGAAALWWAVPEAPPVLFLLAAFGLGFAGMEFATIFVNAMLPDLGPRDRIGRISGAGWAFGYLGGVVALAAMLLLFAENADGRTLLGAPPALGLDGAAREGTRLVGPFTALWYALFMLPFFLWVRDTPPPLAARHPGLGATLRDLGRTLAALPRHRSRLAFLLAALFYRDGLNGMFTFGGIYAVGVLGWGTTQIGVFGILAALTGAVFAWAGGFADDRFGPKPVIAVSIATLLAAACAVVLITRDAVFGIPVGAESALPDIAFLVTGCVIGAAGGAVQAASRSMMVRQADPLRMTEGFGLYALSGKATAWLAPLLIALATTATGSQRLGILPLVLLFLLGLLLLVWVRPDGDRTSP
jgi:MFS transporter, UMF1 family